ncbi:MAG: glycosyltransferase family 2 protein [Parasphingopyxis sp.]
MNLGEIYLSQVSSAFGKEFFRKPIRNIEARQRDYEEKFDYLTIFNDVFWSKDGNTILCLGPRLTWLSKLSYEFTFSCAQSGEKLKHDVAVTPSAAGGGTTIIAVEPRKTTLTIELTVGGTKFAIAPQPNLSKYFSGRNVLITLQKDNKIEWIRDWCLYYRENFGFDSFLIYDNSSSDYSTDQLRHGLSAIDGCHVVDWPFRYGPQLDIQVGAYQDSASAQPCMLAHCHHRALLEARVIFNADIDELLYSDGGDTDLVDACVNANSGYARFERLKYFAEPDRLCHATGYYEQIPRRVQPPKWILAPRGRDELWPDVHRVVGVEEDPDLSSQFSIAHIWNLNSGWKIKTRTEAVDLERHKENEQLKCLLEKTYRNEADDAYYGRREFWSGETTAGIEEFLFSVAERYLPNPMQTLRALKKSGLARFEIARCLLIIARQLARQEQNFQRWENRLKFLADCVYSSQEFLFNRAKVFAMRGRGQARSVIAQYQRSTGDQTGAAELSAILEFHTGDRKAARALIREHGLTTPRCLYMLMFFEIRRRNAAKVKRYGTAILSSPDVENHLYENEIKHVQQALIDFGIAPKQEIRTRSP